MRIDAHHHFWDPARGDYGWMPSDDPVLSRPYAPADLKPALDAAGIDRTILVQAAPTVAETEYLLGIAETTPWVAGVVGWIDFARPDHLGVLRRLAEHPKFLGVRPMIQDIADVDWMLRRDVQWGFDAVATLGLRFDALGFPRHLKNFRSIMIRHPGLHLVVDHCMKPDIAAHPQGYAAWADGIARLAEAGAFCKLSGLVTEAAPGWTAEGLHPYVAHVFEVFGPQRVMWGSDWPVCRLRGEYADWHRAAETLVSQIAPSAAERVFGGTAAAFYGIEAREH